jgi:hypothetical protein
MFAIVRSRQDPNKIENIRERVNQRANHSARKYCTGSVYRNNDLNRLFFAKEIRRVIENDYERLKLLTNIVINFF